jgi:hypothetical protein
MARHFRAW